MMTSGKLHERSNEQTVLRAIRFTVELVDPFGTVWGHGEITRDEQVYAGYMVDSYDLELGQVAQIVGEYTQDDAPNPVLRQTIRVRRAE
jgi:hypothetical protein